MHKWFQNLNENKKRLFHFRGSFGSSWEKPWVKYELSSGKALRFTLEAKRRKTFFSIGFIFFTLYIHLYFLRIPLVRKHREYGFYIHEWTVWMFFVRDPMSSSSSDPWYYEQNFDIPKFFFGKQIYYTSNKLKTYNRKYFMFRDKEYCMDSIKLNESFWFRSRIPHGIYYKKGYYLDVEISKPPMHTGKGTTSYNCDDDGSYRIHAPYDGPKPTWQNQDKVFEHCCKYYCDSVSGDIKRYGRVRDDRERPAEEINFEYIGTKDKGDQPLNSDGCEISR